MKWFPSDRYFISENLQPGAPKIEDDVSIHEKINMWFVLDFTVTIEKINMQR